MTSRRRLWQLSPTGPLLTVLALGACLSAAPDRTPAANDRLQLQAALNDLDARQTKALAQQDALAKRLERLELERATTARETQELASRLGTLTTELAATSGRVDTVNGELQALSERLATMTGQLQELTARLSAAPPVEPSPALAATATPAPDAGAPAAAPASPPGPPPSAAATPAPVPVPAPAPAQSGEPVPETRTATAVDPQGLYSAGYTDYGRGNYALAIGAFREFIRRYPSDEMAGNAQYWIAESYLGLAHRYANGGESERASAAFDQAVDAFQAVGQRYPRSDKAPAALFREAGIHFELGQTDRGRARLEYLVEHFPSAPEARLARQRLAESAKP